MGVSIAPPEISVAVGFGDSTMHRVNSGHGFGAQPVI